jgi:hypothetical protein
VEFSPLVVVHLDCGLDRGPHVEAAIGMDVGELAAPRDDIRSGDVDSVGEREATGTWE